MLFKIRKLNGHQYVRRLCSQMISKTKTVKVEVEQGVLVGQQALLPNGIAFNSFRGVPYAVPPLGELRFKSPVPLHRFDVPELDCTSERDVSHQRDPFTMEIVGSENCLFLNVYAPQTQKKDPLPVMVWIHGGGFFFGNGNSDYFLPLSLMEEDVIVVTLNYRLGALGFLSLPEEGIWGNAGLKDQRLALEWVQQNIGHFNGDPGNVTLFGESAGAASVHMHTYARHAHKLFHKAIMQSGTANMEWAFQVNPGYKSRRLAELIEGSGNGSSLRSTSDILRVLQSEEVTPLHMLANTVGVLTPDEKRRGLPLPFRPVIEDSASTDTFIDAPILEMMQRKDVLAMPICMGYNSAEGLAMMVNAVRKLSIYEEDLARLVPRNIPLNMDSAVQELAKKMRDFYLGGRPLSPQLYDQLTDLLSDYHFTVDMQEAAELLVRHQPRAPLYFYRFEYVGGRNIYKRVLQMEQLKGACHGDELFYLFQMEGDETSVSPDDALITKRLSRYWANFAKHNNPSPIGSESPILNCAWSPVQRPKSDEDAFVLDYLAIDKQSEMRRGPDSDRIEFWRGVYRTYPKTDYSRLSAKL